MQRPRLIAGAVLAASLVLRGCSSDDPAPRPDGIPSGAETDGGTPGGGGTNDGGANTGSDGTGTGTNSNPTQSGGTP